MKERIKIYINDCVYLKQYIESILMCILSGGEEGGGVEYLLLQYVIQHQEEIVICILT